MLRFLDIGFNIGIIYAIMKVINNRKRSFLKVNLIRRV